jgi:hypothetical protein
MSWLRRAAVAVYDFVVGDDWRLGLAVLGGLVAAVLLDRGGAQAWWVVPVVVLAALGESLYRAERKARRGDGSSEGADPQISS